MFPARLRRTRRGHRGHRRAPCSRIADSIASERASTFNARSVSGCDPIAARCSDPTVSVSSSSSASPDTRVTAIESTVRLTPSISRLARLADDTPDAVRATSTASIAQVRRRVRPMLSNPAHICARHRSGTGASVGVLQQLHEELFVVRHVRADERVPPEIHADAQRIDRVALVERPLRSADEVRQFGVQLLRSLDGRRPAQAQRHVGRLVDEPPRVPLAHLGHLAEVCQPAAGVFGHRPQQPEALPAPTPVHREQRSVHESGQQQRHGVTRHLRRRAHRRRGVAA